MRRRGTLIVDGVNLSERYGLILTNASEFTPPEPVTNMLEIPGMDGALDLTESLTGDVVYKNRKATFEFAAIEPEDFEAIKTRVSNFLHGKAYDFQLTWDLGYTYHGRFAITDYPWHPHHATLTLEVSADPYKRADHIRLSIPAASGVEARLLNRRRRVSPTVTCLAKTIIGYKAQSWELEPGSTYLNELVLDPGENLIYIDSKPEAGGNTWNDVLSKLGQSLTWNDVLNMRWSELAKYGQEISDDATSTVTIDYDTYDL